MASNKTRQSPMHLPYGDDGNGNYTGCDVLPPDGGPRISCPIIHAKPGQPVHGVKIVQGDWIAKPTVQKSTTSQNAATAASAGPVDSSRTHAVVASLGASVLPAVAAASLVPGSGLWDLVAFASVAALASVGTSSPKRLASDGRTGLYAYPATVRTAAVCGSVALAGGWLLLGVGGTVAAILAGAQAVLSAGAAYLAVRRTPKDVEDGQRAEANRLSGHTRSQDVREGKLKADRERQSDREAEAERKFRDAAAKVAAEDAANHERFLQGLAVLAEREAEVAAREQAHERKVAGVPEGATGTRSEVAWKLFQADPEMSGRTLAKRLRANEHGIDNGRVGGLLAVMKEAARRSAQVDLATLEAIWDAPAPDGWTTEAESVEG